METLNLEMIFEEYKELLMNHAFKFNEEEE